MYVELAQQGVAGDVQRVGARIGGRRLVRPARRRGNGVVEDERMCHGRPAGAELHGPAGGTQRAVPAVAAVREGALLSRGAGFGLAVQIVPGDSFVFMAAVVEFARQGPFDGRDADGGLAAFPVQAGAR